MGSVHSMDWNFDPSWSVHFVDMIFDNLLGPSTLWISILTLRGTRPRCGLEYYPLLGPSKLWT